MHNSAKFPLAPMWCKRKMQGVDRKNVCVCVYFVLFSRGAREKCTWSRQNSCTLII